MWPMDGAPFVRFLASTATEHLEERTEEMRHLSRHLDSSRSEQPPFPRDASARALGVLPDNHLAVSARRAQAGGKVGVS